MTDRSFVFDPKRSLAETRSERERAIDRQAGRVKAWSYSSLKDFEECAHRTFLDKIERVPKPGSAASDRGSLIHGLAEQYIRGDLGDDVPEQLKRFADQFVDLRAGFNEGRVLVEDEWGFNTDWDPVDWRAHDVWVRMKLDAMEHEDSSSARVIDFKTGRKFGNEIKHAQQAQLYAIGAFMRHPELEYINVEFWYLDQSGDNVMKKPYPRHKAMMFIDGIIRRATVMTTALEFPPSPSKNTCKWCPFNKEDVCKWRVE